MPNTKQVAVPQGWNLADQVEELRGKYHLKKKDKESYQESSRAEISLNEKIISYLRQSNRYKRIHLAQHESGDERVIGKVFKDDRKDRLSLQRCTAAEAIEEMDQHVCEMVKFFNTLVYEKENREKKLVSLRQDLERMNHLENNSPEQEDMYQNMTRLENNLDKADVKYDTAQMICRRYQDILEKLKEESLTLPSKLDSMEATLIQQKAELKQLKDMAKDAVVARDTAKRELTQVEQESYEAKRKRDAELNTTRKEVEKRTAEAEKVDRRAARLNIVQEQPDQKAFLEMQQKRENQRSILAYEEAIEKIKMATHVADIEGVVKRVLTQKEIHDRLKTQVHSLESQRDRLKEELSTRHVQYHDLKYTGERKLSQGEQLLERMQDVMEQERSRHAKLTDLLERKGSLLINVKTGISTLLEKMSEVKLKPPLHNYTKGDVFAQLDLCASKVGELLSTVQQHVEGQDTSDSKHDPEFLDFLENQLSPDNVRIKIQMSESQLSEFDYEGNHEVLSRTDIKAMGQKLIDAKHKPKKRSKKK